MWILRKREPSWKPGGPAPQKGEGGGSWFQTAEVKGRSKIATGAGDRLTTASRDGDAQSEYIVHCKAIVKYNHKRYRVSLCYCFRKINHLVPITVCIHPLMFVKLCRAQEAGGSMRELVDNEESESLNSQ